VETGAIEVVAAADAFLGSSLSPWAACASLSCK